MRTYTVHEPAQPLADRLDRASSLVFVRDGFTWSAFLFTFIWTLANRLWLTFIGYVVAVVLIVLVLNLAGLGDTAVLPIALFGLQFAIGFEAASLRRAELRFRGWDFLGSVNGRNREDCERRFFELWLPTQPLMRVESLSHSRFLDGSAFNAARDRLSDRFSGFRRGGGIAR